MQRKMIRNKRKYSQLHTYTRQYTPNSDCLFPEAEEYPSFFEDNLIDEDRTIKLLYQYPHPHQTIFYFQLLKLIYETQETDYEKYLSKIYQLIDNPEFQLILPNQHHPYYLSLSENTIKRMMNQFLDELGEGNYTVYDMLNKYQVIDKIFVIFMRTLLIYGEKCQDYNDQIDPVDIYQFLCHYFEIEVSYYTNCLKFNLSDLFVYFQAENQIYLAYITPRPTEQHLPSSNQFYQADPQEAFNISSVHQMVSEIDIQEEEQCFNIDKKSQSSEQVQYEYSHSQEISRRPTKSIQENSDIKLSYLINDDSCIKSNKLLEKDSNVDKKNCLKQCLKPGSKVDNCYAITEVPPQLENAVSPVATPREIKFASKQLEYYEYPDQSFYNRYDSSDKVKDADQFSQDFIQTGSSEAFKFQQNQKDKEIKDSWQIFKKQTEEVLGDGEKQTYQKNTQKNLKSLYEMRSIRTIVSCNDESSMVQTPIKSSFNPSFQPSFQPSFHQSRKQTTNRLMSPQTSTPLKKNQYTKHGYINNNISKEFTSSFLLKQLAQPYRGNIEALKTKARKERSNIQKIRGM